MRSTVLVVGLVILIFSIGSCRKDFDTIPNYGNLEFSKDTVFLDTIFSNIGSSTYNLKVYNRGDDAITIPSIKLQNGTTSNYRLNVDGIPGKEFDNIDILAKDSIFIFVETTIDFASITDPLYTDKILFDNGNNEQDVDLVTLVQDATFIFPNRNGLEVETLTIDGEETNIQGRYLTDDELNFTAEKPYVIYGYAAVPSGKTLTIEKGAKIHFHNNSGLIVDSNATLIANGTLEEKITFQGDRLEHRFNRVPGQWGTIWFRHGSINNILSDVIIKNAVVGILVEGLTDSPSITLHNTEIYDCSAYGLFGRNTNIVGTNLVIGSAGRASLACTHGGKYNFNHATFANYWNSSLRQLPSVIINNHFTFKNDNNEDVTEIRDLIEANFSNSIIEGNNNVELVLDKLSSSAFNYNFNNCLIRFDDLNNVYANVEELNFNNTSHYQNNIINGLPDFNAPLENLFSLLSNSNAIGNGTPTSLNLDIKGTPRIPSIDIGAFQFVEE
ncbi:choice-of-anchor Q domain-containing protein [Tenacibaculum xiamenense]|uniref:choice-of-anchor Q domain-containing protein n=1 Tax=Tenacibaculum xiamenense TaxID=1261553 RepID=UPI003895C0FA